MSYAHTFHSKSLNSQHTKAFIKHMLAFIAASDCIVLENLAGRFTKEVQISKAHAVYGFQIAIESIHSEMYSLLLESCIKDSGEKTRFSTQSRPFPEWGRRPSGIDGSESFTEQSLPFACVEGIFFSGSFCAIFWLKKRGLMSGLAFSNGLISQDEGLHCDFALVEMVGQRAKACTMNGELMSQYIEFVAHRLLNALGYWKLYNVQNPFD